MSGNSLAGIHIAKLGATTIEVHLTIIDSIVNVSFDAGCHRCTAPEKASNEGMVLKQHWVEGAHYWESALRIIDRLFPELLDRKLQEWMDQYFGA